MIAEIGLFALCLLPSLALLGMLAPRMAAKQAAMLLPRLQWAIFLLVLIAFTCLTISYVRSDFSLALVAQHSHAAKPLLYKITGTWGNHEGSMLLWLLVLAGYGAVFASMARAQAFAPVALAVQNFLLLGMAGFVLLTSNPFTRIYPAPDEGRGMNPVLQDIGLAIHPPMLYLGYVGYSLVFALCIAALWQKKLGKMHIAALRRWALVAWGFLTLGIGLGAWWAYRELGWGGWWFWDPVENASLMPWLLGIALLHCLIALEKRGQFPRAALWMGLSCFILSLLGTFLVRSGVLTSVHAFALDPERGMYILAFLSLLAIGGYSLWGIRNVRLEGRPAPAWGWLSRDAALMLQNLLLIAACTTVVLGTLYPLLLQVSGIMGVTVGHPYFNSVFLPLTLIAAPLAATAPFLAWRQDKLERLKPLLQRHGHILVSSIIMAALITLDTIAMPLIACGIWLLLACFDYAWQQRRQRPAGFWPIILGHGGLALLLLGVAGTTLLRQEGEYMLAPGQSATMGEYRFNYLRYTEQRGPDYREMAMHLQVSRQGNPLGELIPTKRLYTIQGMPTSEAATLISGGGEIYAAIGDIREGGAAGFRFYHKPGIHLVWAGFMLMAAGGFLAVRKKKA
jgi:cytochrome c-type biogenesis protein CcmF